MSSSSLNLPVTTKKLILTQQLDYPTRILVASNTSKIYQYQANGPFQQIYVLPENQLQSQRCIDFTSDPASHSDCVAVGNGIGKISVIRLTYPTHLGGASTPADRFLYTSQTITELMGKHHRACTALSFCPQHASILASGFDKLRNEPSILIWDIDAQAGLRAVSPPTSDWMPSTEGAELIGPAKWGALEKPASLNRDGSISQRSLELRPPDHLMSSGGLSLPPMPRSVFTPFISNTSKSPGLIYPFLSSGPPEPVYSLAWLSPRQLVAGMSGKWLRLFDVRENLNPAQQWSTRTVLGVATDPFHAHRFATFSDAREGAQVIKVWDTRKPGEIFMKLDGPAHQLRFSRHQAHVLYVLAHEHRLVEYLVAGESPLFLRQSHRRVLAFDEFQPHSLAVLEDGEKPGAEHISVLPLHPPPVLDLHPAGLLSATFETCVTSLAPEPDIALDMKDRAERGYSMDIALNITLFAHTEPHLCSIWNWMGCMDQLLVSGRVQLGGLDFSHQGLYRVLQGLTENASIPSQDPLCTVYSSPQRKLALSVCGWIGQKELEQEIVQLESSGLHEKAALLAFLHSDLQRSMKSLLSSQDSKLHLVSATIAGFNPSHSNPAWTSLCDKLSKEAPCPELCAIYTYFATMDWHKVIQCDLSIREKLLVALRYFSDTRLAAFVESAGRQAVHGGSLEGLLFTGLAPEAVPLFAEYVDRTGDVQTAALLLAFVVPRRFRDNKADAWIETYRAFLDRLQLFHARARFDILHTKHAAGGLLVPPQVEVSCFYCNQGIAHGPGRSLPHDRRLSLASKLKSTACPSCRKSLPRCALCLLTLGGSVEQVLDKHGPAASISPGFARWITWCQSCHHGGHAGHLIEWFEKNETCPIADCDCQCALL